jgi:hypothetical protein
MLHPIQGIMPSILALRFLSTRNRRGNCSPILATVRLNCILQLLVYVCCTLSRTHICPPGRCWDPKYFPCSLEHSNPPTSIYLRGTWITRKDLLAGPPHFHYPKIVNGLSDLRPPQISTYAAIGRIENSWTFWEPMIRPFKGLN